MCVRLRLESRRAAHAPSRMLAALSEQIKNRRRTNEVVFQLGNLPAAGWLGGAALATLPGKKSGLTEEDGF